MPEKAADAVESHGEKHATANGAAKTLEQLQAECKAQRNAAIDLHVPGLAVCELSDEDALDYLCITLAAHGDVLNGNLPLHSGIPQRLREAFGEALLVARAGGTARRV